jgi:ElaB/YqjD/DUF883 family membrane-anchored ribosome-binding protein
MAAANRNLEEELDTLKAGLDTLRKDISSLASSFGDTATNEASRGGREGVSAVEHQIEERPFISVLVAFGIGVVIGKLINR